MEALQVEEKIENLTTRDLEVVATQAEVERLRLEIRAPATRPRKSSRVARLCKGRCGNSQVQLGILERHATAHVRRNPGRSIHS